MNFDYSYKAFLISCLLVGGLILLMFGLQIAEEDKPQEKNIPIQYTVEDVLKNEKVAKTKPSKIETHKTYNESKKFIENIEHERSQTLENTQDKLEAMKKAMEKTKISEIKTNSLKKTSVTNKPKQENRLTNNSKSSNSFRLIDRKALYFPNPIYTCDGYGKVIIHIEVDVTGRVIKAINNKTKTSTTNLCLIETAIKYAKKTRFNTDNNKPKQIGSITYIFPGQ